jgi:polar amino acid transport system ATP-binding protein
MATLPIIDVAALVSTPRDPTARAAVARALDAAAGSHGFFYAVNHGVDAALINRLVSCARIFFAQSEAANCRLPCRPAAARGAATSP